MVRSPSSISSLEVLHLLKDSYSAANIAAQVLPQLLSSSKVSRALYQAKAMREREIVEAATAILVLKAMFLHIVNPDRGKRV